MASSTSSYLGRFSILPPFMQTGKIGKTIPVNQTQLQAIDTMIRDQPSIPMSMKNFQDEVLVNPFDVIIAGDDEADSRTVLSLKPEITHLISTYWMPWLQEMDTQTLSYGYCPFYFRYITYQVPVEPNDEQGKEESENDDDDDDDIIPPLNIPRIRNKVKLVKDVLLYYPVTPKRGLGSTETFIFDKEQYLIWKWNDSVANDKSVAGLNTYDTSMYFIIENMPDIMTGNCTNPMASLISHWQELVELRKQNTIMIKNMANPEHAVEYNPSLTSSMSSQNRAYIEGAHPNPFFPSITVGRPAQVAQDSQSQQLVSAINAVTQYQQNTLLPSMNYDQGAVNAGLDPMAQIISSGGAPRIDPQARALDAFNLFMNQNQELLPLVNVIQQSIPNAHYLKPYQHYVAMAKPTTNITQEV